jgi:hypothetical protein
MKSLPQRVRSAVAPLTAILALLAIVALAIVDGEWSSPLRSFFNALLFLAVGYLIRDRTQLTPPYARFRELFFPSLSDVPSEIQERRAFYLVLPTFTATGPADVVFQNPHLEVGEHKVRHQITLDAILAQNDSESAGFVADAITRYTRGVYRPEYLTDVEPNDGRPAVLFGLYSNAWIERYWWDYNRNGEPILRPLPGQVGFSVRDDSPDSKGYREFKPLRADDEPMSNFWKNPAELAFDFALIARLRVRLHADHDGVRQLLCTSIGPAGTIAVARLLSDPKWFGRMLREFRDADEFAVVFRVEVARSGSARPWPVFSYPWRPNILTVQGDALSGEAVPLDQAKTTHHEFVTERQWPITMDAGEDRDDVKGPPEPQDGDDAKHLGA